MDAEQVVTERCLAARTPDGKGYIVVHVPSSTVLAVVYNDELLQDIMRLVNDGR